MKNISIYTLTSELHDEIAINKATQEFLGSLNVEFDMKGSNFNDYGNHGEHALDLIYVRTGGTESIMKSLLPSLLRATSQPIYLLTSGKSNSLAASLEILSYLRQNNIEGEIIHGTSSYISKRIKTLSIVSEVHKRLRDCRFGIVGNPSDWLISSEVNKRIIRTKLGIDLVDISMSELLNNIESAKDVKDIELISKAPNDKVYNAVPGALKIYVALRKIIKDNQLDGLTIRCFDLLTTVHNTGCVALAKLNSEGFIAGCEGDVPAMLSMKIAQIVSGVSGFQANPARINPETGEMLFAHCTIPFDMVDDYELDTHFESGIGVGIRGFMKSGDVTVFKVSGDLSRIFVAEGTLLRNQSEPNLCRTQQVIRLDNAKDAEYFLKDPIGNHHIIIPGHYKEILQLIFNQQ